MTLTIPASIKAYLATIDSLGVTHGVGILVFLATAVRYLDGWKPDAATFLIWCGTLATLVGAAHYFDYKNASN